MSGRSQVAALFALRWRMVRSRRVRIGLLVLAGVTFALLVMAIASSASVTLGQVSAGGLSTSDVVGSTGPVDRTGEIAALLPSMMLAFGLFCVIAPLSAGGGTELIPEAELVAYPVRVPTLREALADPHAAQHRVVPPGARPRRGHVVRGARPGRPRATPRCAGRVHGGVHRPRPGARLVARRRTAYPSGPSQHVDAPRRGRPCGRVDHPHRPGHRGPGLLAHQAHPQRAAESGRRRPARRLARRGGPARRDVPGLPRLRADRGVGAAPTGRPRDRRPAGAVRGASPAPRHPGQGAATGRSGLGLAVGTLAARPARARRPAGRGVGHREPAVVVHRAAAAPRVLRRGAALRGQRPLARRLRRTVDLDAAARPGARAAQQGPGRPRGGRGRGPPGPGGGEPPRVRGADDAGPPVRPRCLGGVHCPGGGDLPAALGHPAAPRGAARPARHPGAARHDGDLLRPAGRHDDVRRPDLLRGHLRDVRGGARPAHPRPRPRATWSWRRTRRLWASVPVRAHVVATVAAG